MAETPEKRFSLKLLFPYIGLDLITEIYKSFTGHAEVEPKLPVRKL